MASLVTPLLWKPPYLMVYSGHRCPEIHRLLLCQQALTPPSTRYICGKSNNTEPSISKNGEIKWWGFQKWGFYERFIPFFPGLNTDGERDWSCWGWVRWTYMSSRFRFSACITLAGTSTVEPAVWRWNYPFVRWDFEVNLRFYVEEICYRPGFFRVSETAPICRGKNTPVPAHSLFPPGTPRNTALIPEPFGEGFTECFRGGGGGGAQGGWDVKPTAERQFLPSKNSLFLPLFCGTWGCGCLTEPATSPTRAAVFICSMSCCRFRSKNCKQKQFLVRDKTETKLKKWKPLLI